MSEQTMLINNEERKIQIRTQDTLLDVIRNQLGLKGTKFGCGNGDCGSCTIIVDGWPQKSCLMLAAEADGKEITTIEGLRDTPIQKAFVKHNAFQCGYCTSGFITNIQALLTMYPDADHPTVIEWLESNICRCTSYQEMKEAIREVTLEKEK